MKEKASKFAPPFEGKEVLKEASKRGLAEGFSTGSGEKRKVPKNIFLENEKQSITFALPLKNRAAQKAAFDAGKFF